MDLENARSAVAGPIDVEAYACRFGVYPNG
jgi:hypothetical protein